MTDTRLRLDSRDGLPDALRVLLEAYPPDSWQGHDNFGGMVQFWLERHLMFRRLVDLLQTDAAALLDKQMDPAQFAPRVSRFAGMLLNQLHGHHQIEDNHYFPQLIRLDARLERGFDLLEADHQAMDGLIQGLADAANLALRQTTETEIAAYAGTLTRFGTLLNRHLEDEEQIIVPVILHTGFDG